MGLSTLRVLPNILSVLTTACAIPFLAAQAQNYEIGTIGIHNCDTKTSDVQTLLSHLPHILIPALQDLSLPTSSNAYTTFFKDIAHAPYIHSILYNITTSAPLPSHFPGTPPLSPAIFCLTGPNQIIQGTPSSPLEDFYHTCHRLHAFALAQVDTPRAHLVLLCPLFWTFPAIPDRSNSACLSVLPHSNRFWPNDAGGLMSYQVWVLLHELAHHYIYETYQTELDIYAVNECVGLSGSEAVGNAQSFAFYVANIWARCTSFPSARRHHRGGELLEITNNNNSAFHSGGNNSTRGNTTSPKSGYWD